MSLLDMIEQAAGSGALQQIGARVGLSPQQLESAIGSLAPALAPGLVQHAATGGLAPPGGGAMPQAGSDEAADHGRSVLGSILGSKEASRSLADNTSAETGIGADKIKALLPHIASIAATAMTARGGAGGGLGGLGGLLGGLANS